MSFPGGAPSRLVRRSLNDALSVVRARSRYSTSPLTPRALEGGAEERGLSTQFFGFYDLAKRHEWQVGDLPGAGCCLLERSGLEILTPETKLMRRGAHVHRNN